MDNILSTLKGEYSRTLLLIVIPGAIAIEPFFVLLYKHFNSDIKTLSDYMVYTSIIYLLASIFVGFIIQDLGSRLEQKLDRLHCKCNKVNYRRYLVSFRQYLFNKKEEDYIITHYYRSMLIRMRFELHTCCSIVILWIGCIIRAFYEDDFRVNWPNTYLFVGITALLLFYLLWEAYSGVETLGNYRTKINKHFNSAAPKAVLAPQPEQKN